MTQIEYAPKGTHGFRVALETGDGHVLAIDGEVGQDDVREITGDAALVANPSLVANLWGYASQEHQRRRARNDGKRRAFEKEARKHRKTAQVIADLIVRGEGAASRAWCSGCFNKSDHVRVTGTKVPVYLCGSCGAPTVRCAVPGCTNHASRGAAVLTGPKYCAEHCHEVPSFERVTSRLTSISDYEEWLSFDKTNAKRVTQVAGLTVVGGAVVGPMALVSAPAIGGGVGAMSGLTGAAATSHGLATIGFGPIAAGGLGMAGGTAIITATGTALGGVLGGVMTTAYVGSDKSFKIIKLRDGEGHPVIIASGFLTESKSHWGTWRRLIDERYPNHPVYRVHWGTKELKALGSLLAGAAGRQAFQRVAEGAAKRAAKGANLGPLAAVLGAFDLGKNPWSVAKSRAAMTGVVLADLIARSDEGPYILVGHSLGARVMATAAEALSTKNDEGVSPYLADVHLLGAAIGHKGPWGALNDSVSGTVYNYWSTNDRVLSHAYSVAQVGQKAAGAVGLAGKWPRIANRNVSQQVKGHSDYFATVSLVVSRG